MWNRTLYLETFLFPSTKFMVVLRRAWADLACFSPHSLTQWLICPGKAYRREITEIYLRKTTATEDRYSTSCIRAEFLDQMEEDLKGRNYPLKIKILNYVTGISVVVKKN